MVILIWIQVGFAMVVLGAALKAIPEEILEAARIDGATGTTLFRTVQIPMIRNTLIVVATTITIASLKIFDIVFTVDERQLQHRLLAQPDVQRPVRHQPDRPRQRRSPSSSSSASCRSSPTTSSSCGRNGDAMTSNPPVLDVTGRRPAADAKRG